MAENRWLISMDGKQLEGERSTEEARAFVQKNQGKNILVWTQGMAQWSDPATVPALKAAPAAPQAAPQPAPASASPIAGISKEEIKSQAGLLKSLLEFRFETFVTARLIPILYVIVMVVIALGALASFFIYGGGVIVTGVRFKSFTLIATGLVAMALTPVIAVLYLALVRMWFEVVIVFFRIKEDLTKLVERGEKK